LKIEVCDAKENLEKTKQELKNISISRKWLDKKVVISFKERVPEVFINIKDKKMGLDFDNKPFDLAGNMSDMAVPTIKFNNDKERIILLTFFKNAKEYIKDLIPRITEIKYGDVDDINLTLDNNINIYWGLPKENKIEDKSYKLQKILDDLVKRKIDIQSIDLSFIDENKDMVTVKRAVDEKKDLGVN
jgi:cell division septal protein FtsQ